jgi:hypothetical protein
MKFMQEYEFHMSHQREEHPTTVKVAISCTSCTKGCLLYLKSKCNSWKDLTIAFVTWYPARLPRWTSSSLHSTTYVTLCSPLPHEGITATGVPGSPHYPGFTITLSRTPLNKWSAQCRNFYLTTHNTHKRQTSMPPGRIRTCNTTEWAATDAVD